MGEDAGKQTVTHSVIDDKESAFWVLLYVALRYLKNNLSETQLYDTLSACFNASSFDTLHRDVGASPATMTKLSVLKQWAYEPGTGVKFNIPEVNHLLHKLAEALAFRYVCAEDTSARHQRVYDSLLKVFGPDSDEVQTNTYFQYLTAKSNMEDTTTWFHETLRAHADLIPLPPPNTDDEHINQFYPKDISYATKHKLDKMKSNLSQGRFDYMRGDYLRSSQKYNSHLEDGEEQDVPNPKKKKTKK